MAYARPIPDDDDDEFEATSPHGSLGELEEMHEEPIDLDVGSDETIGLDAATFDEELDAEDLVAIDGAGGPRLGDEPLEIEDDEDDLVGSTEEYGLCEGIEPPAELDDAFAPLAPFSEPGEDGGEDGLAEDDGLMDLGELPPLDRIPPDADEDLSHPPEPIDLDDLD